MTHRVSEWFSVELYAARTTTKRSLDTSMRPKQLVIARCVWLKLKTS